MFDVDPISLLTRQVLRERLPALVAEACAWSVGMSDREHYERRHGRVRATGQTLGARADTDLSLSGEEDARLELGDARAGSFADALNALTQDGRLYAELFDEQVLTPFVLDTCVQAVQRAESSEPAAYQELLADLDDDGSDVAELVRVAEWEVPLKTEAEQLLLAALADVPLVEAEAEGLPLSLVRAAEAETRAAAATPEPEPEQDPAGLTGALFLAEVALRQAELPLPVPPEAAPALLKALTAEGIEPDEVLDLLPHLPVLQDTAEEVAAVVERQLPPG